jgi:HNH endonuclease
VDVDRQVDPERLAVAYFWNRCLMPKKLDDRKSHWLYRGPRSVGRKRGGNVATRPDGRKETVQHRAWELVIGPVPTGWGVSAACHVQNCCAPHHLVLVKVRPWPERTSGREVA